MCGSMVDIQSAAAEIRRGKRKKKEDRNHRVTDLLWPNGWMDGWMDEDAI